MNETEQFKKIWEDIKDLGISEDNMAMISCCILKEIEKTQRTHTIKEEKPRGTFNNKPTEKQLSLLKKLKIPFTDSMTKMEASKLISEALKK